jgi:hypothetical protein
MRRIIVGLVVAACTMAGMPAAHAKTVPPKWALVYGDSLMVEASRTIISRFAPKTAWRVEVHAWPQISLCSQLDSLRDAVARTHPRVVTIESHGSQAGACMAGPDGNPPAVGSDEYYARIGEGLEAAFRIATSAGSKVVFVVSPPSASDVGTALQDAITAKAREKAALFHGVSISNAARNALGGTTWRATMRCLANETAAMGCTNGKIAVRAPDKLHFCPVPYPDLVSWFDPGCTVYSSGAFRFGRAIVTTTVSPPAPVVP